MGQSFPNIKIVAVGKVKKTWLKDGIQQYLKRLPEVQLVEIKDSNPEKEADKLLASLSSQDRLAVLAEYGKTYASVAFSSWLADEAYGKLVLFIGGPEGISNRLKNYPMVSLSAMTFPHEIARLMLVEQLYRAKTILQNGSYHK